MASQCQNILLHECFKKYDETKHLLNIDENAVATIVQKPNETESTVREPLSSQNFHTEFDEHLIMAVLDRPSLYNHRLNIKERSKLKKSALWEEVKNTLGGDKSIKDLQKRWKYHRDCYIRAKRKLKEYVPSGSDASSANFKCSYRFYELMKPLDDVLETNSTINTLSNEAEGSSNENTVSSEFVSIHQQSLQPSSAPIDTENTNCSEVESSISLEVSTAKTSSAFDIPTPISTTTTKKQKSCNQPVQIQTALLDVLKTPDMDAVDGFLKMLGEALRRLPYRKRAIIEIKILQMVLEAETKEIE